MKSIGNPIDSYNDVYKYDYLSFDLSSQNSHIGLQTKWERRCAFGLALQVPSTVLSFSRSCNLIFHYQGDNLANIRSRICDIGDYRHRREHLQPSTDVSAYGLRPHFHGKLPTCRYFVYKLVVHPGLFSFLIDLCRRLQAGETILYLPKESLFSACFGFA